MTRPPSLLRLRPEDFGLSAASAAAAAAGVTDDGHISASAAAEVSATRITTNNGGQSIGAPATAGLVVLPTASSNDGRQLPDCSMNDTLEFFQGKFDGEGVGLLRGAPLMDPLVRGSNLF